MLLELNKKFYFINSLLISITFLIFISGSLIKIISLFLFEFYVETTSERHWKRHCTRHRTSNLLKGRWLHSCPWIYQRLLHEVRSRKCKCNLTCCSCSRRLSSCSWKRLCKRCLESLTWCTVFIKVEHLYCSWSKYNNHFLLCWIKNASSCWCPFCCHSYCFISIGLKTLRCVLEIRKSD
jgi:hypothetical protein